MDSTDGVEGGYRRTESEDGSEAEKTPMIGYPGIGSKAARTKRAARSAWVLATLVISLTANAALLSLWLWLPRDLDATCLKHTTAIWSPIMDDVKISYKPHTFEGNPFHRSPYLEDPSPEVDKLWIDMGVNLTFTSLIPEERGSEAGLDPSSIKIRPEQGGGYVTTIRVLHQLHCMNMIRQVLPWNTEYYSSRRLGVYEKAPNIVRIHIDHCLDMVRQELQCNGDAGMFGLRWVQEEGKPLEYFPSFSSQHMCRNFDDIRDWAFENQFDPALEPKVRDTDVMLTKYD